MLRAPNRAAWPESSFMGTAGLGGRGRDTVVAMAIPRFHAGRAHVAQVAALTASVVS